MALPILETPENKGQIQEIISDIATEVFKSAKISMESAAKAVVPSVPEMVDDVIQDLRTGSVRKFNLAMDKLDKLVNKLGVDLKQYSKELANFADRRQEKLIKSEEKIQQLREKNIVAIIDKSGDVNVLSKIEIQKRQTNLRNLEKNIADMEKALENDRKLLQESNKLNTNSVKKKREEIAQQVEIIEEKRKEREEEKQILGQRGEEQPGIFTRAREGVGNFVEEYVPQPLADIGSTMVEGFMAPINAVKELGASFGQLLKPLKALKPLFTGLLGSLKKFALGLKATMISFLPFLAIAGLVVLALGGLYLMLKKAKEIFNIGDGGPGSAGDIAGETYMPDETPVAEEGDMSSRIMRKGFYSKTEKEFIQPDDSRYDDLYRKEIGKEPPKKGEVFIDGERKILPLTEDGQLIKSSNFMENRSAENLRTPDNLKPIEKKETGDSANISNTNSQIVNQNTTTTVTGISGPRDRDMEIFYYANPLYR